MKAYRLRSNGSRHEIRLADALPTARGGAVVVLERALAEVGFLDPLVDTYLDQIAAVSSPECARQVCEQGLERLHEFLDAESVIALLESLGRFEPTIAIPLSRALVEVTTDAPPHYFIGSEARLRAMIPFRLLDEDALKIRRMRGRMLPLEPHRDLNSTMPIGGLSLWCAVTRVLPGNSFVVYDDDADGPGVVPELEPGDVVVFGTERLHASIRNDTDETRLAVTTRVVLGRRLRYGPGVRWTPFADASLTGTRLDVLSTVQSRLTKAAVLRWRHTRRRRRRLRAQGRPHRLVEP